MRDRSAQMHAKTVEVWEAHRCPRCRCKWAIEAPNGGSGKTLYLMCAPCNDDIRCWNKKEHADNCHCNFGKKHEKSKPRTRET